ncbi:MAG: PEP-CTERM sorting domain-containing protein [Planctomycetota bacterium]
MRSCGFWVSLGGNCLSASRRFASTASLASKQVQAIHLTSVPEPGTLVPLGLVAFGLLARGRRRAETAAQDLSR